MPTWAVPKTCDKYGIDRVKHLLYLPLSDLFLPSTGSSEGRRRARLLEFGPSGTVNFRSAGRSRSGHCAPSLSCPAGSLETFGKTARCGQRPTTGPDHGGRLHHAGGAERRANGTGPSSPPSCPAGAAGGATGALGPGTLYLLLGRRGDTRRTRLWAGLVLGTGRVQDDLATFNPRADTRCRSCRAPRRAGLVLGDARSGVDEANV